MSELFQAFLILGTAIWVMVGTTTFLLGDFIDKYPFIPIWWKKIIWVLPFGPIAWIFCIIDFLVIQPYGLFLIWLQRRMNNLTYTEWILKGKDK